MVWPLRAEELEEIAADLRWCDGVGRIHAAREGGIGGRAATVPDRRSRSASRGSVRRRAVSREDGAPVSAAIVSMTPRPRDVRVAWSVVGIAARGRTRVRAGRNRDACRKSAALRRRSRSLVQLLAEAALRTRSRACVAPVDLARFHGVGDRLAVEAMRAAAPARMRTRPVAVAARAADQEFGEALVGLLAGRRRACRRRALGLVALDAARGELAASARARECSRRASKPARVASAWARASATRLARWRSSTSRRHAVVRRVSPTAPTVLTAAPSHAPGRPPDQSSARRRRSRGCFRPARASRAARSPGAWRSRVLLAGTGARCPCPGRCARRRSCTRRRTSRRCLASTPISISSPSRADAFAVQDLGDRPA